MAKLLFIGSGPKSSQSYDNDSSSESEYYSANGKKRIHELTATDSKFVDSDNKVDDDVKQTVKSKQWLKKLKFVLGLISFILFLMQTITLTREYLAFKTVINSHYLMPTQLTMPAITICSPVPIAFNALCDTNETIAHCHDRLDDQTVKYKPNLLAKLIDKYLTGGNKSVRSLVNNDDSILSTGCSIARSNQRGNYSSPLIRCATLSNTVDSIIYNTNKRSNIGDYCQTWFSMFDAQYNASNYKINLIDFSNLMGFIFLDLTYEKWFPSWYHERGISLAIHPPNMIPSDIEWPYVTIYSRESYDLVYKRTSLVLMESPYETNCNPYKSLQSMSKSDCERRCIFNASYDREMDCINQWNVILLSELTNHTKLCPISLERKLLYFKVRETCQTKCMPDCYLEKYSTNLNLFERNYNPVALGYVSDNLNLSEVRIKHSSGDDKEIVFKEAVLFTTLIANIGGLGGLYLGLSLVALYDTIVDTCRLCRKLLRKWRRDNKL